MKYVSLDIETTGLTHQLCDILEIGAYVEDTSVPSPRGSLPEFHCYIWKDHYWGEPYALAMNAHIFKKILELKKNGSPLLVTPDKVALDFGFFLNRNFGGKVGFVAGKNVAGFDLPFLAKLPEWNRYIKFHHRVIDPGSMYFNPLQDEIVPDLAECKRRAKLPEIVSHEALDDAWDVIQLIRAKFPLI